MYVRGPIGARLVAQTAPCLPVDRYVIGKRLAEVEAILPRLFNLCRGAQVAAVSAALGRPAATGLVTEDVLRDHLLKLHVAWPGAFGIAPRALSETWQAGGEALVRAVFGATAAPATWEDFEAFMSGGSHAGTVLSRIAGCFAPGEAVAEGLPEVTPGTIWSGAPVENSVAMRHADHPVMRRIAHEHGRGPLWRATARLYDIEAAARGRLPDVIGAPGWAVVPAARGLYGIRMGVRDGIVTEFARVTPTDALVMPGGILERCLASLPGHKAGLGPLLLDILDPCSPVRLREVQDA